MWTDQTALHRNDAKCELIRPLYIITGNKRSSKSLPLNTLVMLLSHVQHSKGAKSKTVKWRKGTATERRTKPSNDVTERRTKPSNDVTAQSERWWRDMYIGCNWISETQTIVSFTRQNKLSTPVNTNWTLLRPEASEEKGGAKSSVIWQAVI